MEVMRISVGQAGDTSGEDRLEVLYSSQAPAMTRLAYLMTGDAHTAQDIVHEAFIKIGRKLFRLRDQEHERAYLYRTVVNLCRGRARKLQSERGALAEAHQERPRPGSAPADPTLWAAVRGLPPRQQAALFLRYHQDFSEAQTADALDCSVSAVKSLVHRALNELRETTMRSET